MALPLMGPGTFGQIFTFSPTRTQLASGVVTGAIAGWCHADGTIGVLYPGATELEHYSLESGDQFAFEQRATVSILDGTWSFMEGTAETDGILLRIAGAETLIQYDPQDLTTMYQDATGTLPVYRPGTGLVDPPVGLMLDKGQGLELGPELAVLSSPLIQDSGSNGATWDASTRTMYVPNVGTLESYPRYSFNLQLVTGKRYVVIGRLSGDISKLSTPPIRMATSGFNNSIEFNQGTGEFRSLQIAGWPYITFLLNGKLSTPFSVTIDNISVREIKGYHAYQSTTTARPTLSGRYNLLTATETLSTQSVTTVATDYTLRFEGTGSITLSGTATGTYSAGTHTITCSAGALTCTVAGTVTRADLRVKLDGSSLPAYQAVTNANTYDTAGFPLFFELDQTDDQFTFAVPTEGLAGTQIVGELDDTTASAATLSAGAYSYPPTPATGEAAITQWVLFNKTLSTSETLYAKLVVNNKGRRETE